MCQRKVDLVFLAAFMECALHLCIIAFAFVLGVCFVSTAITVGSNDGAI